MPLDCEMVTMQHSKYSVIDVIAVGAVCLMLLGAGLPVLARTREYAGNIKCASNLKQIGVAILFYSNANRGTYPRTRADDDASSWTEYSGAMAADPFAEDGPKPNDITAAMFLLLRTQEITPEVFVCPLTSTILPWDYGAAGTAKLRSNFPSGRHLGYSYINPYPSAAAKKRGFLLNNSISAEFPVMADMNPGGADLLKVGYDAPQAAMKRVNSRNHYRGYGQAVMFGDGHAEFLRTPFVGVQRDNIYTYGRSDATSGGEGIVGSPHDANDSILLPVATIDPGSAAYPPWDRPRWHKYAASTAVGATAFVVGILVLVRRDRLRNQSPVQDA